MSDKKHFRSATLQNLYDRYVGDDPERVAAYERAHEDANIAQEVYNLRAEAGLSQRELAALINTTASVICRLEDADYEGHSMSMLRRIAAALGKRVVVRFEPAAGHGATRRVAIRKHAAAAPKKTAASKKTAPPKKTAPKKKTAPPKKVSGAKAKAAAKAKMKPKG
jgi:transcriptional regulator with XRE-family HTH domain